MTIAVLMVRKLSKEPMFGHPETTTVPSDHHKAKLDVKGDVRLVGSWSRLVGNMEGEFPWSVSRRWLCDVFDYRVKVDVRGWTPCLYDEEVRRV